MAVRTTIGEWRSFVADDTAWAGVFMDDTLFEIEGSEVEEVSEDLGETTPLSILHGDVVREQEDEWISSLESFFRKWKKKQKVQRVLIEVPRELDAKTLREAVKLLGGRVIQ